MTSEVVRGSAEPVNREMKGTLQTVQLRARRHTQRRTAGAVRERDSDPSGRAHECSPSRPQLQGREGLYRMGTHREHMARPSALWANLREG